MSQHNTIFIDTPEDAPWIDHEWIGPTYGPAFLQDVKKSLDGGILR